MNFIAKSMLILFVIALAIGGAAYSVMSANVKQSGTINLAQQNLAKETRPVTSDIEQVEMNGPFDLAIIKGDHASLTLEGEERLLPKVVIQQDGKILHILTKGMLVTSNQTVKIILTIPKLTALNQFCSGDSEVQGFSGAEMIFNLNGSGDLTFAGQFQHLVAQTKGSGNIEMEVGNVDQMELTTAGSGDIVAIGRAKKLSAIATGSGTIDTERLITQRSDVISHGNGSIKIYANTEANVTLTGTGDVEIYGNPGKKNVTNTGSGEVRSN